MRFELTALGICSPLHWTTLPLSHCILLYTITQINAHNRIQFFGLLRAPYCFVTLTMDSCFTKQCQFDKKVSWLRRSFLFHNTLLIVKFFKIIVKFFKIIVKLWGSLYRRDGHLRCCRPRSPQPITTLNTTIWWSILGSNQACQRRRIYSPLNHH